MDLQCNFHDNDKLLYDLLQRILHLIHKILRRGSHTFHEYKLDY